MKKLILLTAILLLTSCETIKRVRINRNVKAIEKRIAKLEKLDGSALLFDTTLHLETKPVVIRDYGRKTGGSWETDLELRDTSFTLEDDRTKVMVSIDYPVIPVSIEDALKKWGGKIKHTVDVELKSRDTTVNVNNLRQTNDRILIKTVVYRKMPVWAKAGLWIAAGIIFLLVVLLIRKR